MFPALVEIFEKKTEKGCGFTDATQVLPRVPCDVLRCRLLSVHLRGDFTYLGGKAIQGGPVVLRWCVNFDFTFVVARPKKGALFYSGVVIFVFTSWCEGLSRGPCVLLRWIMLSKQ